MALSRAVCPMHTLCRTAIHTCSETVCRSQYTTQNSDQGHCQNARTNQAQNSVGRATGLFVIGKTAVGGVQGLMTKEKIGVPTKSGPHQQKYSSVSINGVGGRSIPIHSSCDALGTRQRASPCLCGCLQLWRGPRAPRDPTKPLQWPMFRCVHVHAAGRRGNKRRGEAPTQPRTNARARAHIP